MSNEQQSNIFGIPLDGPSLAHAGHLLDVAISDGSLFTGVTSNERLRRASLDVHGNYVPLGQAETALIIIVIAIGMAITSILICIAPYFVPDAGSSTTTPVSRTAGMVEGSTEYALATVIARTYDEDGNVTREFTSRDIIPPNATLDSNALYNVRRTIQANQQVESSEAITARMEQERYAREQREAQYVREQMQRYGVPSPY